MTILQRAATVSVLLHITIVLFLTIPAPFHHYLKPEPTRPMIIDFVKIGAHSMAPKLGPQTISDSKKNAKKTENKENTAAASVGKADKPIAVPKKQTNDKQTPAAKAKNTPQKTISTKGKKQIAPKTNPKASPKTSSKSKPAKNTKNSAAEKKAHGNKAKVDLAKKGTMAHSVSDLVGKMDTKGHENNSNAALAEMFGDELTGTEIDALNKHMKQFWNMPSGHQKASEITVEVELFIRPDASVEKVKVVDERRMNTDPEFRIAAESALRAVLNPACSPLPLNPDKYDQWKHMIFVFDPNEMCT